MTDNLESRRSVRSLRDIAMINNKSLNQDDYVGEMSDTDKANYIP